MDKKESVDREPKIEYKGPTLLFQTTRPNAEIPFRDSIYDVAFKMTLIEKSDKRQQDDVSESNNYETYIAAEFPVGFHAEITGTEELLSKGYMLAISPLIISSNNRSPIKIPLFKFREGEDLELPYACVAVILRQTEQFRIGVANPDKKAQVQISGHSRTETPSQSNGRTTSGKRSNFA